MSDCILYKSKPHHSGYSSIRRKGKHRKAHVWAWIDAHDGQVPPKGMNVCHTCDVPACVNPDHLFLGTQKENLEDMRRKGRGSLPPCNSGEHHPMAKIKMQDVHLIRDKYSTGNFSQRLLAKEFHIGQTQICRIIHDLSWKIGGANEETND